MTVGEVAEGVDFLVLGGGPGGYTAALEASRLGRDVLLVDRAGEAGLGGVCLHAGCIPSKALIEVAEAIHRATHLQRAGVLIESIGIDLEQFQQWKNEIVLRLADGVKGLLKSAGVEVVQGDFRFTGPGAGIVLCAGERPPRYLEFKDVVIATGSTHLDLPGLPRDGEIILNSTDALAMAQLPSSLAVVGGGYIGVELGTALRKLGSRVTLIEAEDALLPAMDAHLVTPVHRRLAELGVDVRLGTRVVGHDGRRAEIRTRTNTDSSYVEAEKVIVAIGRRPNTGDLGLDTIGVTIRPDGLLEVGKDRRLSANVAAIGDVTPGPALAHKATAEALVAAAALCGKPAAFDPAAIPIVVFSDPEIAVAGWSGEGNEEIAVSRHPFTASGRALTMGSGGPGFVRMSVERSTEAIVGVQIVGAHASELISEGVLAIEMAATPVDVWGSIHPHPTLSEVLADVARHLALDHHS